MSSCKAFWCHVIIETTLKADDAKGEKYENDIPLYSKTLHIFVRLESTVELTSFTAFALSLELHSDVNHFVRRILPVVCI
jgi:hypothetical protein